MKYCRLKNFILTFSFGIFTLTGFADPQQVINEANQFSDAGDFKQAASVLIAALQNTENNFTPEDKKRIEYQLDLLGRTKQDYSLTEKELYEKIDKSLTGLTQKEFAQWLIENRFDGRIINGIRYFTSTSVSNLYWRHPELNARRRTPKDDAAHNKAMLENCRTIKATAIKERRPYVLPHRYQATMSVTAEENVASAGEIIRAWLPVPRRYLFQKEFKILSSSPRVKSISDENNSIRSAYLEQPAKHDKPTEFKISYEYVIHSTSFQLQPGKIKPVNTNDPALKPFLAEAPHVVFSDKIKSLAEEIIGTETNQMLQAKAFFNWIADNIKYSYAREYSTLTNISDYCASNRYGDCGQEALLFITLCRSQGIPARWQSGWHLVPGKETIHDWTEIYLDPYGWVPADPWAGIHAMQYCPTLKPEERREIRDFYFGGLDQYRMIANSDHNQTLTPAKKSFRSDDVDFQRGELETGDRNIYFNQYSYKLVVDKMEPAR